MMFSILAQTAQVMPEFDPGTAIAAALIVIGLIMALAASAGIGPGDN